MGGGILVVGPNNKIGLPEESEKKLDEIVETEEQQQKSLEGLSENAKFQKQCKNLEIWKQSIESHIQSVQIVVETLQGRFGEIKERASRDSLPPVEAMSTIAMAYESVKEYVREISNTLETENVVLGADELARQNRDYDTKLEALFAKQAPESIDVVLATTHVHSMLNMFVLNMRLALADEYENRFSKITSDNEHALDRGQ